MNLRRTLSQAALVIGALVFSIGLQAFAAGWTAPTAGPTGGNAVAPLDTGATTNYKSGQLFVNIDSGGNIGSASNGLVVGGNIDATNDVCIQPPGGGSPLCLSSLTGGAGSSFWGGSQSGDISNINSGNVNINSGGCYYKFQNGALHTNCNVSQDVIPGTVTFSGSTSGFAGAQKHCLIANGSQIGYDAWCTGTISGGTITIAGCSISGPEFNFGNTGDPTGTLTASGGLIGFSNGGTWTSTCQLTGSLNIVGGGGGVTITGNGSGITASGHGSSGTISVAPASNKNVVWGTKSPTYYLCPNIPNSTNYDGYGDSCYGTNTCGGQLTTSMNTCTSVQFVSGCQAQSYPCSLLGSFVQ